MMGGNTQGVRALVVDDQSVPRMVLSAILKNVGVKNTRMSDDAEHAFAGLEQNPADVIFTDIQMPGWDGKRLLTEVRSHAGYNKLPVIAVSTLEEDELNWRELGFNAYVHKPCTLAGLKRVLQQVLPCDEWAAWAV